MAFAAAVGAVVLVLATGHVSTLVAAHGVPRYRLIDVPNIVAGVVGRPGDPGRAWDAFNSGAAPPGPVVWWSTFAALALVSGLGGFRASDRNRSGGLRCCGRKPQKAVARFR